MNQTATFALDLARVRSGAMTVGTSRKAQASEGRRKGCDAPYVGADDPLFIFIYLCPQ
ncbi:MAG: hypothetical protein V4732_15965 [Pseudomonadota bacterium]